MVSVHMPVYNGVETLPLAIRSLQLQGFSDWEAVVVDDGSADCTADFVASLEDPRIQLISLKRNRGRAYARSVALEASRGDFIAYLDCDDFYHPAKLEKQLARFKESPEVDAVGCGVGSIDPAKVLRSVRGKVNVLSEEFRYVGRFPFLPGASMIRAEVARRAKYRPHIKLGEDTDYFFRILQFRKFANIPEVLYFYDEYRSVTLSKVYMSYAYTLLAIPGQFPYRPADVTRRLLITIAKMAILPVLVGIKGWHTILAERGQAPSPEDLQQLEDAKAVLKTRYPSSP